MIHSGLDSFIFLDHSNRQLASLDKSWSARSSVEHLRDGIRDEHYSEDNDEHPQLLPPASRHVRALHKDLRGDSQPAKAGNWAEKPVQPSSDWWVWEKR